MTTSRFVRSASALLATAFWLSLPGAYAKPVPAALFTHHAVLQQQKPIPVWGRAEPGEKVTVAFAGAVRSTVADAQGNWRVNLDALPASSEGRDLTFTGADGVPVVVKNVVVGEVWLASGQSNMEWRVAASTNAKDEIAAANFPLIRQFGVRNHSTLQPTDKLEGQWSVCSPATAGRFGAVAYFFARDIHARLNVPIGILHSSWVGTPAEAWTRREVMDSHPDLRSRSPARLPRWSGPLPNKPRGRPCKPLGKNKTA
ncbi:MAG: hypothetical protein RL376_618 [Verrucomicrobiota bacterium]|jgi:sialate O-acetylesterase